MNKLITTVALLLISGVAIAATQQDIEKRNIADSLLTFSDAEFKIITVISEQNNKAVFVNEDNTNIVKIYNKKLKMDKKYCALGGELACEEVEETTKILEHYSK